MSAAPFERRLSTRMFRAVTRAVGGLVGLVSPGAALRYLAGRQHLLAANRRSYAAGRPDGPNQNWRPANRSADANIRRDGKLMLSRSRDLADNNPSISGALVKIVNNVVRTGIWPRPALRLADGSPDKPRNKILAELWDSWADRAEATNRMSLYGLQRLALRHWLVDGEVLVHAVVDSADREMPLRFELIECDQLDDSVEGILPGGNTARGGIEYDAMGRAVAYHVLPYHPGDVQWFTAKWGRSTRIPAEDCLHLFSPLRASQHRGVPVLAAVIMRMFDLDEYQDYEMIGAKLAAAFGVFITTPHPEMIVAGQGLTNDKNASGTPLDYIEPGRIDRLAPGEDIKFAEHHRPGDTYEPFVKALKRDASTGVGMSYETFSNDYSEATYSSARQALLEERRGYVVIQDFLNERLNAWLWRQFLTVAWLTGAVSLPDFARSRRHLAQTVRWTPPGWEWIDPLKDGQGVKLRLELGLTSRTREAARIGDDFEEIAEENARDQEIMPQKETADAAAE